MPSFGETIRSLRLQKNVPLRVVAAVVEIDFTLLSRFELGERRLSFDDLLHYQRIVAALAETRELMERIDQTVQQFGGWPLES